MSAIYKGFSGLALFVSIPLLIRYLGNSNYGFWVLIVNLFQLVLLMDFGVASSLKTKIPELQHKNNVLSINSYIRSTYKTTLIIALILFVTGSMAVMLLDLKSIFKLQLPDVFVRKIFIANIFFFCINFVMNTHKALFVSVHRGKYSEQSIAVNQAVFLILLIAVVYFFDTPDIFTKLYIITLINGGVCLAVNTAYTIFFFKTEPYSMFNIKSVDTGFKRDLLGLGMKYMAIQVGSLFLFSSDVYILAYFFGPKEVVAYEIVNRYFQFPLMILMAAMAPIWSLFTKYYLEQDTKWLRKIFKIFNVLYIFILAGLALCVLLAQPIMEIWIGKSFNPPTALISTICILTSLRIFTTFYSYFFNGTGNLKSYLFLLFISVILKLPLSYIFVKNDFGSISVVLASIVCLTAWSILQPAEAYKVIRTLEKPESR
jgi:O-antigen/teichoic acid export membrane protein